jgi:hypothetical protein
LDGSFIPFAARKEQRVAAEDPRKSLEERYGSHQAYVKAVTEQAKTLVGERFLLEEDAARSVREAETSQVLATPSTR